MARPTAMVKSTFNRDAYAKTHGSSSNEKLPPKSPRPPYYEGAMRSPSPNKEKISPTISSVVAQLEAVRINVQCTIQLIEHLVDMVSTITERSPTLKMRIFSSAKKLRICITLLTQPPGPFLSTFINRNSFCLRKCPSRMWSVFSCTSHPGLACCFYTFRDDLG
jgi:hypothetical protein